MGEVFVDLLPLLMGATLVPIYPIIALIILRGEGGLSKAIALLGGAVALRLLQGIIFGSVFETATEGYTEEGSSLIVYTLLLVLGIALLIKAYTTWRKEEDPEDSPPKWMTAFSEVTALKAAGVGALYVILSPKQWVFTLSAISTIGEAKLSGPAATALYLLYTIGTQLLVLIPILMVAVAPQQADKPLKAAHEWLGRYSSVIIMVVSLIFGLWLLFKGINGLLA